MTPHLVMLIGVDHYGCCCVVLSPNQGLSRVSMANVPPPLPPIKFGIF